MASGWQDPFASKAGRQRKPASSWGDPFHQSKATTKAKSSSKKHSSSFWHTVARDTGAELVGNLGRDIGSTAVGVGPGLYRVGKDLAETPVEMVLHPGRKSMPIDKDLKQTAKQYEQTYGPLAKGHLGEFARNVYQHPLGPILDALTVADLGASAGVKTGLLSGERAELVTRSPRAIATGKGPVHTDITSTKPLVRGREVLAHRARQARPQGEAKLYGKQIAQQASQHALGRLTDYQPYLRATKGLSQREWAALHIRAMDVHPDDLAQVWQGSKAERWASDPKVKQLVLHPSKKLVRAEREARRLSAAGEKLLKQRGLLTDETAAARPGLTRRQVSELLGRPARQLHGDPFYLPHTLDTEARSIDPLRSGGGKGVPRRLGATKQNQGALVLTGKLHLRGDVLGPEFLRRVKFLKFDEIHNALVRGAVRVTRKDLEEHYGGQLPKGYEFIRVKPGERIPATMRGEGEQTVSLEKLIPNPEDVSSSQLAKDGFSTADPAQAFSSGGRFYLVPSATVRAATGEFTRVGDLTRTFVQKPLAVWRAAVLGLRPGFFTNNLVGNSVMYSVKTGGRGALRDLFASILEQHGANVARKALDSAATPPALRKSLYEEFFPEQVHGTFGRTQSPTAGGLQQATSKAQGVYRGVTSAIPKATSAVAETGFRRALVRHYIRTSPEFKAVYKSLPAQTRSFEAAARKVLEGKGGPQFQRWVSKQANNALGDYLNLSAPERNVLRNLVPFYAWYKAIAATTLHLAADTPLRANVLGQLGQVGKQWSDAQLGAVPSFLEGSIPLGKGKGGTSRVLSTQGANPYATISQLLAGGGDISALGGNPFLQALLDAYASDKQRGFNVPPGQVASDALLSILRNLPAARVIAPPPPSQLYPNRNRRSELESFFGVPVKEFNPGVAASEQRAGR